MEAFSWRLCISISAKLWLLKYPVGCCTVTLDEPTTHTPGNSFALDLDLVLHLSLPSDNNNTSIPLLLLRWKIDVMVPPYHVRNPSRLSLWFFSKAARQDPKQKASQQKQRYEVHTKIGMISLFTLSIPKTVWISYQKTVWQSYQKRYELHTKKVWPSHQ